MRYIQVDLGAMVMEPDKLFVLLISDRDPNHVHYPLEARASLNGLMKSHNRGMIFTLIEGGRWTVWRKV